MNIRIICAVCRNPLPVLRTKQKKVTLDFEVGFCGHCETMAHKVEKELLELYEQERESHADDNQKAEG